MTDRVTAWMEAGMSRIGVSVLVAVVVEWTAYPMARAWISTGARLMIAS
jgi:hypothetical protein